jgi:type VI secretion system protein ImpJ
MVKPIFWHQGLFLQPHHFQLNDLYNQSLSAPWFKYAVPFFWGVGRFKIRESALSNSIFDVSHGEFLFPDNTLAVLGENAVIQPRSFESVWEDQGTPFSIYVGLKNWDNHGGNVMASDMDDDLSDVSRRFFCHGPPKTVNDLHGDGPEAQIRQMDFLVKIIWETEIHQMGDYQLIPIAQVVRHLDEIVVSDAYIPPCLNFQGSAILAGIIKEIKEQLTAKTRQLETLKRSKGIHTAEFGSRDMVYMLALRSLNRYLPLLNHQTSIRQTHPWLLYGVLKQIVGELSSFSAEVNSDGELEDGTALLPAYDHKKLWACFSAAQQLITRLLDEITSGPEYIIPLHFDGTFFSADLSPDIFQGYCRFFLVLETQSDRESLFDAIKHIAKLGTRETLPILIAQSLSGIKLEYLELPPQELPRKTDAEYFRIDHNQKQWAPVEESHNISLYWDTAPEDLIVTLMVVKRGNA